MLGPHLHSSGMSCCGWKIATWVLYVGNITGNIQIMNNPMPGCNVSIIFKLLITKMPDDFDNISKIKNHKDKDGVLHFPWTPKFVVDIQELSTFQNRCN